MNTTKVISALLRQTIKKCTQAFGYSRQGLYATWSSEFSFRIEVIGALLLTPIAFLIGKNIFEITLLIGSLLLIIVVELINSAIETVVNRISTDQHILSKKAKDQGSAAVLLTVILSGLIWFGILLKNL